MPGQKTQYQTAWNPLILDVWMLTDISLGGKYYVYRRLKNIGRTSALCVTLNLGPAEVFTLLDKKTNKQNSPLDQDHIKHVY